MGRLSKGRVLLLSFLSSFLFLLFLAVILNHHSSLVEGNSSSSSRDKQFSHRRIQSGPPKHRRPPPPPPHRRRPNRPPPPQREREPPQQGGNRHRQPTDGPPPPPPQRHHNNDRHHGNDRRPPPPRERERDRDRHHHNNHIQNNNNYHRPGPPPSYNGNGGGGPPPPRNNNEYNNHNNNNNRGPPPHPPHPFTQQSPTIPAPSTLNPPVSTLTHPHQPMNNPPISEYAPPLNTFKANSNGNNNNNHHNNRPSHGHNQQQDNYGQQSQSQSQQIVTSANGTKHHITFTVTKKPNGGTAINFQIRTPQDGGNTGGSSSGGRGGGSSEPGPGPFMGHGPSTYRPPLSPQTETEVGPAYPNTGYSMKNPTDEASANDLLNPPPVFYNPTKDVIMNKDHPLNHMKNEIVHDPVKEYGLEGSKFSQPDPLYHIEDDNRKHNNDNSEDNSNSGSSQILIAGHKPIINYPKKNSKEQDMDSNQATQQLLAALGISKDPLISMPQPQGEPLGLTDYIKSQPLFNKPDRIVSEENTNGRKSHNNKDQTSSHSTHYPSIFGSSSSASEDSSELGGKSYLHQKLHGGNSNANNKPNHEPGDLYGSGRIPGLPQDQGSGGDKPKEPTSYIEQRLKGITESSANIYGTPPPHNFGDNFGLTDNKPPAPFPTSYLEQKLRQQQQQAQEQASYIQKLLDKEKQQQQDLLGAYGHISPSFSPKPAGLDLSSLIPQPSPVKPLLPLDLSQFAHQQQRFGPSTQSPSSIELEEYEKTDLSNFGGQPGPHYPADPQASASGKIGYLNSNVLLPGGFGGLHLQQQQHQQQQPQLSQFQQQPLNPTVGSPIYTRPGGLGGLLNQLSHLSPQHQQQPQQTFTSQLAQQSIGGHLQNSITNQQLSPSQIPSLDHPSPSQSAPLALHHPHHHPHPHSGSVEQGQGIPPYGQESSQQSQQQQQQLQQRYTINQDPRNPQYQAINPQLSQQGGYQPQSQSQYPQQSLMQQQQHQQGSINNYQYQQSPHQGNPIAQQTHLHPNAISPGHGHDSYGHPTPSPQQVFVVTEAEPIIEIIVQDSNVTLPPHPAPPPPPPTPPPTPEPVHVFYVKYSENKFPHGGHDPEINLEHPVPSINVRGPDRTLQIDSGSAGGYDDHLVGQGSDPQSQVHRQGYHHHNHNQTEQEQHVPSSTTLRTLINPAQNVYTNSKLAVHFDQPPETYPFDISQYHNHQKSMMEQNQNQNYQQHNQNEQNNQFQQQDHAQPHQIIQQIQQQTDNHFLSKRIGLDEFSSLLQEGPQHQGSQQEYENSKSAQDHSQQFHQSQSHQVSSVENKSNQREHLANLPPDVPHHLKQQLINSGILNHADVQVVNFDENLFKELSSLPPEAISALQQQTSSNPSSSSSDYAPLEDLSSLMRKRQVRRVLIDKRRLGNKRRPGRSVLIETEDKHWYRLMRRGHKVARIC